MKPPGIKEISPGPHSRFSLRPPPPKKTTAPQGDEEGGAAAPAVADPLHYAPVDWSATGMCFAFPAVGAALEGWRLWHAGVLRGMRTGARMLCRTFQALRGRGRNS